MPARARGPSAELTPPFPRSWFDFLTQYLKEIDADFATWAWNGSTCFGDGRTYGDEEGYGIANICWNGIAFQPFLDKLQELQPPSVFPRPG